MKPVDLFVDVSRYLTDFSYDDTESYVHWEKADLLNYFRLAVNIVANENQRLFTKQRIIKLVPGNLQNIPDEYGEVIDVLGHVAANGTYVFVGKADTKFTRSFTLAYCKEKEGRRSEYKATSWGFLDGNKSQIFVDPPVPVGAESTLSVLCYSPPRIDGEMSDVSGLDRFRPVIFELMLYYAWGVDIESSTSRERSSLHWTNAITLLNSITAKQKVTK